MSQMKKCNKQYILRITFSKDMQNFRNQSAIKQIMRKFIKYFSLSLINKKKSSQQLY